MAVIYITESNNTQHKFRLPTDSSLAVTIGRNADCLISLPQVVGISGLHCSISLVDGKHIIKDEGSTNGTLEGKRAITSEPLRAGATYTIGTAAMTYDPERPVENLPLATAAPAAMPAPRSVSPALAEAAAAIAGPKRKAVASSALAEAAAAIGVKGVAAPEGAKKPEDAPAASAEKKPGEPAPKAEEKADQPREAEKPKADEPAAKPEPARRRKAKPGMSDAEKKQALAVVNFFYVAIVLALAFYAGLTLRHWVETGNYLPSSKPAPAKAAPAAKPAAPVRTATPQG